MRVFVVAGELSGDILGATLMREMKVRHGELEFRGIGGPRMIAEGLESLYPLETLSVMGLAEVVRHLPRLIGVRRHLQRDALEWGAEVMVGIDAPDFNLGLEAALRQRGVATAHYVSPSVWAWRQGRIKKIHRAVDLMLTFLPFEAAFYQRHRVPVAFVGHPLAEELPLDDDRPAARRALGLGDDDRVLALLPGSRASEIGFMTPTFIAAVRLLRDQCPDLKVVIPAASAERRAELIDQGVEAEGMQLVEGRAWQVMTAADAVLLTSGTAALEAMLCHRPMVVAYRMAPVSWQIARRLVKTRWISLPNLIANEPLVPELIQYHAEPQAIAAALTPLLHDSAQRRALSERFVAMHRTLMRGASARAAEAVLSLVAREYA
ncbi:lipid-A-disaccharide synthase [Kushneria aurantia]|uniref:Lipid-A-disaccharide synthase n=1 Tax=Kushneria aurantia TaxID=504092 RepID=A0ABV6G549_9GAMM|nr:lipid-A-disaccharide synthase [Kushneria aurantia]